MTASSQSPPSSELAGRVALVTGGSRGIGQAVAARLAQAGATVVAASRSVADDTTAVGPVVHGLSVDVSDPDQCAAAVAHCHREFGSLDLLVHSAGIAESAPFLKLGRDDWQRHLAIDVEAAVWLVQAALPEMMRRGHGRVISIASVAAHVGFPYVTAYVAAKHALLGVTRSWAAEFPRSGVTFNCVSPYYVDTPMVTATIDNIVAKTSRTPEEARAALLTPQGRLVSPEEVAAACLFLCGDDSASINGQSLRLDGGLGAG